MHRLTAFLSVCALLLGLGLLLGPSSWSRRAVTGTVRSAMDFFPLDPDCTWTYQVENTSSHSNYRMMVRVIGEKFVPALNLRCLVVDEYEGAGAKASPLIYYFRRGFLNRMMALEYVDGDIRAPAWGRSEEMQFLPTLLTNGESWQGDIFPFGHNRHAMHVKQLHQTFPESRAVTVPAGVFHGCLRVETLARFGVERPDGTVDDSGAAYVYNDWYAPDVGLIRTIARPAETSARESERIELVAFDPPGAGGPGKGRE